MALALVALVGRDRGEVAARVGLSAEALGDALAYVRKQLRRTLEPLPGSGWCERAERLISDRLDSALGEREARRLDAHLRNCPRCVEHERRLVQATDALVASVAPLVGPPDVKEAAPVEEDRAEPVEPAEAAEPEAAEPDAAEPEAAATGAAEAPPTEPASPEPEAAEPAKPAEAAEPRAAEPEAAEPEAAEPEPEPAEAKPRAAAAVPPPVPVPRPLREFGVVVTWQLLIALAVLLAVASLALAVAGVFGADL